MVSKRKKSKLDKLNRDKVAKQFFILLKNQKLFQKTKHIGYVRLFRVNSQYRFYFKYNNVTEHANLITLFFKASKGVQAHIYISGPVPIIKQFAYGDEELSIEESKAMAKSIMDSIESTFDFLEQNKQVNEFQQEILKESLSQLGKQFFDFGFPVHRAVVNLGKINGAYLYLGKMDRTARKIIVDKKEKINIVDFDQGEFDNKTHLTVSNVFQGKKEIKNRFNKF